MIVWAMSQVTCIFLIYNPKKESSPAGHCQSKVDPALEEFQPSMQFVTAAPELVLAQ